jgi:hypothetical protein
VRGEKEVLSAFQTLCSTALTLLDVSDNVFKVVTGRRGQAGGEVDDGCLCLVLKSLLS